MTSLWGTSLISIQGLSFSAFGAALLPEGQSKPDVSCQGHLQQSIQGVSCNLFALLNQVKHALVYPFCLTYYGGMEKKQIKRV